MKTRLPVPKKSAPAILPPAQQIRSPSETGAHGTGARRHANGAGPISFRNLIHSTRANLSDRQAKWFGAPVLHAKMRVSQPHDPQEKEADEVAAKVMNAREPEPARSAGEPEPRSGAGARSATPEQGTFAGSTPVIAAKVAPPKITEVQRETEAPGAGDREREEEEEKDDEHKQELSRKVSSAAGEAPPEDDDPADERGSNINRAGSGALPAVDENLEARIRGLRGKGRPLAGTEKSFFESRFGRNFGQVRLHTDGQSEDLAKKVNAKAFAVGENIVFGKGYYQPGTRDGRELMAHELTHVVQQGKAPAKGDKSPYGDKNGAAQGPAVLNRAADGDTIHRAPEEESGPILDKLRGYADQFAGNIPGYRLLTLIIGLNPITGKKVQRTALNFVQSVVALIPGGDVIFQRVQQSKALPQAYNWLVKEFGKPGITWPLVKGLMKTALKRLGDLGFLDLFDDIVGKATQILKNVFGPTLKKLINFAGKVATKIKEFIFRGFLRLVGGREGPVFRFLNPIVNVLGRIFSDPVAFGRNLIGAVKKGFGQFMGNFVQHFKGALFGWMFGTFSKAGIQVPTSFDPPAIFGFITQLFAITWQDIRAKIVRRLGPKGNTIISAVEKSIEVVQILITQGPQGLWTQVQQDVGNIKETILGAVLEWVRNTIIVKAITKIAMMLNPAGAIVQAVLAIYNTVMFFIERFEQIKALVQGVMASLNNIVLGKIGPAANHIEKTMGRALTLVISFLARFIGLGNIVKPIKAVITRIKKRIDRAIDRVITAIVKKAKALFGKVKKGAKGIKDKVVQWWRLRVPFRAADGQHNVVIAGGAKNPRLEVRSKVELVEAYIKEHITDENEKEKARKLNEEARKHIQELKESHRTDSKKRADIRERNQKLVEIVRSLVKIFQNSANAKLPETPPIEYDSLDGDGRATGAHARLLHKDAKSVIGGGSQPRTEQVRGWGIIKDKALTSSWVRMHLINHKIGGTGEDPKNLVPGPKSANAAMELFFERPTKKIILESKKPPPVMWVDANVRYYERKKPWAQEISMQAGMYAPKKGGVWEQNKTAIFARDFAIPKPPIAGIGERQWSVTGGTRFALRELVEGEGVKKNELVPLSRPRNFAVVEEVRAENPGSVGEFLKIIRLKNENLADRFELIRERLTK